MTSHMSPSICLGRTNMYTNQLFTNECDQLRTTVNAFYLQRLHLTNKTDDHARKSTFDLKKNNQKKSN